MDRVRDILRPECCSKTDTSCTSNRTRYKQDGMVDITSDPSEDEEDDTFDTQCAIPVKVAHKKKVDKLHKQISTLQLSENSHLAEIDRLKFRVIELEKQLAESRTKNNSDSTVRDQTEIDAEEISIDTQMTKEKYATADRVKTLENDIVGLHRVIRQLYATGALNIHESETSTESYTFYNGANVDKADPKSNLGALLDQDSSVTKSSESL